MHAGGPPDTHRDLRTALDQLAARGEQRLRARNVQYFVREGAPLALFSVALPPLAVLYVQTMQRIAGADTWVPGPLGLGLAMLLAPLVVLGLVASWAARRPVDRASALGLFDRAADAEDRLVTADELLAAAAPSGFAAAALADAHWFLTPARAADPEPAAPPAPGSSLLRGSLYALAGVVLAWTALRDPGRVVGGADVTGVAPRGVEVADAPLERDDPPARVTPPAAGADEDVPPDSVLVTKESAAAAATRPGALPDDAKRKEGKGGAGRSSQAQASRGESDARGAPTNQGQESKRPVTKKPLKPTPKKRKPKKKKKGGPAPDPKKAAGEESGSTAGRGSSRGSNRNPVTSDWTSKDQVTTEEDEEIEDDEEVEDESEDSEARGGVQPSLRDRKPPVSRDLSIGFGNQPNPNAAGRGGPSQPKKSRGTASLVLGVPIPDRVKGQPNPGKTKVTQERVEPRREKAAPGTASARGTRRGPSGPLARPELSPWLRDLLRSWFLELRKKEKSTR